MKPLQSLVKLRERIGKWRKDAAIPCCDTISGHKDNCRCKGWEDCARQLAPVADEIEAEIAQRDRAFVETIKAWREKFGGPWLESDPIADFKLLNQVWNEGFEDAHALRECGHSKGDFRDAGYIPGKPKTYTASEKCVGCEHERLERVALLENFLTEIGWLAASAATHGEQESLRLLTKVRDSRRLALNCDRSFAEEHDKEVRERALLEYFHALFPEGGHADYKDISACVEESISTTEEHARRVALRNLAEAIKKVCPEVIPQIISAAHPEEEFIAFLKGSR